MPHRRSADEVHYLERHETAANAVGGRTLRDLGDCLFLYTEDEREPFGNRVGALRWPSAPAAFDARLAEILALFAVHERRPHVWTAPDHREPSDVEARLAANGFTARTGAYVMVADREPPASVPGPEVTVERWGGGPEAPLPATLLREVAAEVITPRFRSLGEGEVMEKNPGDLVTVADREAEVREQWARLKQFFERWFVTQDGQFKVPAARNMYEEGGGRATHLAEQTTAWKIFSSIIRCHQTMAEMEKPIVAKINGENIAFGSSIMFSSDLIYARDDARIGDNHLGMGEMAPYGPRWGMVPGDGGAALAPLYFSPPLAKEYLMLGRTCDMTPSIKP